MLTVVMIFSLTACSTGFLSDNDMLNVPEDKNPVVTFTLEYDNNDGLGKRIVELSGGKIEVNSAEGKGTTFSVSLPKLEKDYFPTRP